MPALVFVVIYLSNEKMDIGVPELLIILVIIILLFGPSRFGKIMGELGSGLRFFKDNLGSDSVSKEKPKKEQTQTLAEPLPSPDE